MTAFAYAILIGHPLEEIDAHTLQNYGRATLFHIFEPYRKKEKKRKNKKQSYIDLVSPSKAVQKSLFEQYKPFYKKYGIAPSGKLIDRKEMDNNWMNEWEEMWQDPLCCASGKDLCLKQSETDPLTEDCRCMTCGFYCHSMC